MSTPSSQTVSTKCSGCGTVWKLPARLQGQTVKCKKCNASFSVAVESSVVSDTRSPVSGTQLGQTAAETSTGTTVTSAEGHSSLFPFALAGLLATVGAVTELFTCLGSAETVVRSAIGCIALVLTMMVLAGIGRFFVGLVDAAWLRFSTYLSWSLATLVLILMFVVPGWSYKFPYAHYKWVNTLTGATPTVIGAVLLKYAMLWLLLGMVITCLWGRSSPVRGLTTWLVYVVAKLLWLPEQIVLWIASAPRALWLRWVRRSSSAGLLWLSFDSLTPKRRHWLTATAATIVLGLVGFLASSNPGTFKTAWTSLFQNPQVASFLAGLTPRNFVEPPPPSALAGGPYRVFTGLKVELRGSGADPAGSKLVFEWDLDGDGIFGETGTAASRGDEVGTQPTFSTAGLDRSVTVSLRVTTDDDDRRKAIDTATVDVLPVPTPPPIVRQPLVRSGERLAWHVVGEDEQRQRRLGYVEKEDASRQQVYFREILSGQIQAVPSVEVHSAGDSVEAALRAVWPQASMEERLDLWARKIVWQVARELSVPEGVCTKAPDPQRRAEVSLPPSPSVKEKTPLHVVRIETVSSNKQSGIIATRERNLGAAEVVELHGNYSVVNVPEYLDLQVGDWVFPQVEDGSIRRVALSDVEVSIAPLKQSQETKAGQIRELGERLSGRIRSLLAEQGDQSKHIEVVPRSNAVPGSYLLSVKIRSDETGVNVAVKANLEQVLPTMETRLAFSDEPPGAIPIGPQRERPHPHLLVSAQLATVERMDRARLIGWFDELQFFGRELPTQVVPVSTVAGRGEEAIPFRDLLSNTPRMLTRSEIVPGSLEWLGESDLKRELPFENYVAWKIARSVLAEGAEVVLPDGDERPAIAWLGSRPLESVFPPGRLSVVRAGRPSTVKNLGTLKELPSAIRLEGELKLGDRVLLRELPEHPPKVLFLDNTVTVQNEEIKDALPTWESMIGGGSDWMKTLGVAQKLLSSGSKWGSKVADVEIRPELIGSVVNGRIRNHLVKLEVDVVSEATVNALRGKGIASQTIGKREAADLAQQTQATHVVLTDVAFVGRPDRAHVAVTLVEISKDGNIREPFGVEDKLINVEEIFPDRGLYPSPPYMLPDRELVRLDLKTDKIVEAIDPLIARLRGRGHVIAQLEKEQDEGNYLIRFVSDQSLARVPKELVAAEQHCPREDISRLGNYWDIVFRVASEVAQELCPKAGEITHYTGGREAGVNLGTKHGLVQNGRLRVVRFAGPAQDKQQAERFAKIVGQVRVGPEPQAANSVLQVPPDVEVQPGDVVYPHSPPRVHLVVHPLKVEHGPTPAQGVDWSSKGRQIAEELVNELGQLGIPLVADLGLLDRVQQELGRPGVNKQIAAARGRAFGATHVLTGTITPVTGRTAKLEIRLVDVETGELNPIVGGRTGGPIHESLGANAPRPVNKGSSKAKSK